MEPTKDGAVAHGSAEGEIGSAKGGVRTAGKAVLTGKVVSDKMNKTIVVAIMSRRLHGLYKKYVQVTKKVKAHDELNEAHEGDTVRVVESRPMSKEKRWRLLEIVERAR